MSKRVQLRRGTTAENNAFTGAVGEVTVDTNKKTVVVHDGVTAGGFPVAAIANNDGTISLIKKDGTVITTISASGLFNNTLTSTATDQALTAAQGKVLQDNKLDKTANAVSASKLATARTINGVSFDGTANITVSDSTKLPLAGGTMYGIINFNLSDAEGAFHKLIEGNTVTDGGYIAVGNYGWDRGYVEIGTIDDHDAAIYARKRNSANVVLDEAIILGSDGNTSFPRSVYIHNVLGGYGTCGLVAGNGDNADYGACNIDIASWFGLGIKATNTGERTVVFNARNGDISTRGSLYAEQAVNGRSLGVNSTDGSGVGISLYGGASNSMPDYGIALAKTHNYGTHGSVVGDWATYFTMSWYNDRGWIFKSYENGNVASISTQGNAQFNGNVTASSFTGTLTGNANTATRLQTARTINGVSFDGTENIDIPILGNGQEWRNVKSSRAVNTTYTNTTGKPIIVNIVWKFLGGTKNYAVLFINGIAAVRGIHGWENDGVYVVIPAGSSYQFASAGWGFVEWMEYR